MLSIWKRKAKMLLVLFIVTTVITMVMTGFTIGNATDEASLAARQKLGAIVTALFMPQSSYQAALSGNPDKFIASFPNYDTLHEVSKIPHVKGVYGFSSEFASSPETKPYPIENDVERPSGGIMSGSGSFDYIMDGITDLSIHPDFSSGTSRIIEGNTINDELKDEYAVVVEKRFAEYNNITVGNIVPFCSVDGNDTTPCVVVGIYETSRTIEPTIFTQIFENPPNRIYATIKAASTITLGKKFEGVITRLNFILDDPLHITEFSESLKNATELNGLSYSVDAKDDLFQQMVGPISKVASTSKLIVVLTAIAGVIILALVLMVITKDRTYEIGVLMSLGEKKIAVAAQMVLEILIVSMLAFSISCAFGNVSSNAIGKMLLQNEVTDANQSQYQQSGIISSSLDDVGAPQAVTEEEIDVIMSIDILLKTGFVGLIVVMLSTISPTVLIIRKKPREIFSHIG